MKILRTLFVLSLAAAAPLRAQTTSPVDDLITRVIEDVNDLRYADAIRRGREVFTLTRALTPAQEVTLRSAMAAAFYPEEIAAQQPDSALLQFTAAIFRVPDATLPPELHWSGLDSLLSVARRRTFAVQFSGAEQTLTGTEQGTLSVVSSRPVRFVLRTALQGSTAAQVQDSTSTPALRGTLNYRAHNGRDVLLAQGSHTATVIAIDANGDSAFITHRLDVTGSRLMLIAPPALDSAQLKPETTARPKFVKAGLTTLAFALATFTIGGLGGDDEDFGPGYKPDGRATFVGMTILSAGVFTYFVQRNKPDPAAVAANTALRDAHRKAMDEAEAQNRTRINQYRVTVKFVEEIR